MEHIGNNTPDKCTTDGDTSLCRLYDVILMANFQSFSRSVACRGRILISPSTPHFGICQKIFHATKYSLAFTIESSEDSFARI